MSQHAQLLMGNGRRTMLEYKELGHKGVRCPFGKYTSVRKKVPVPKAAAESACLIPMLCGVLIGAYERLHVSIIPRGKNDEVI